MQISRLPGITCSPPGASTRFTRSFGGAELRNTTPVLAGSFSENGLSFSTARSSSGVRTITSTCLPRRPVRAFSSLDRTADSESLLSKSTFPLWMYVRTDWQPSPVQISARSFMAITPEPPTLMPRSRAMYFCMRFLKRRPGSSGVHQLALQVFERLALGFGIREQHREELHRRHDGKKDERNALPQVRGAPGKHQGDDGVHRPVAGVAHS